MTNDSNTNPGSDEVGDELDARQLAEADALEAILTGNGEASRDVELGDLVDRMRSAFAGSEEGAKTADAFQARRVAQRVLTKTTREDMRRRGDIGVILRFAGDRLRDSALLKVAAALLIVQLTLVPLVAWQIWRTPHSGVFQTGIEPSVEELAQALEDLPADELDGDLGEDTVPLGTVLDREALELGAAEAASVLNLLPAKLASAPSPTTSAGRALAAMTLLASREHCTAEDTALAAGLEPPAGPFESIVFAEAHLYLLGCGGGWEGLLEALEHVVVMSSGAASPEAAEQSLTQSPSEGLFPGLAARTMRRAGAVGVAISAEGVSLIESAGGSWHRGGRDWLEELGTALKGEAGQDPYVAAWLDAIVQDS